MSNSQAPHETHHQIQAQHHQMYQQQPQLHAPSTTAPGAQPVFDLGKFWMEEMHNVQTVDTDFKNHPLPLARIKKVMKTDQDVKMISAEAPILFAKGCEIFITELTKRAWVHAEENKRRTLQRSDIATAITKTDMCDFLIDIVPREEARSSTGHIYDQNVTAVAYNNGYYPSQYPPANTAANPASQMDPGSYYSQLPQFTTDQVQQYQMLQQYQLQQQQQQQQQQSNYDDEQQQQQPETE